MLMVFELVIGFKFLKSFVSAIVSFLSICYCINFYYAPKDWGLIVEGFVIPYIPSTAYKTALGLIGSIIVPYNLYLHSSLAKKYCTIRYDKK